MDIPAPLGARRERRETQSVVCCVERGPCPCFRGAPIAWRAAAEAPAPTLPTAPYCDCVVDGIDETERDDVGDEHEHEHDDDDVDDDDDEDEDAAAAAEPLSSILLPAPWRHPPPPLTVCS